MSKEESHRVACRKSYRKHRVKRLEYNATWRENNRKRFRKMSADWKKRNPVKTRDIARDFRAKNPEHARAIARLNKHGITPEQFALKLLAQENKCAICNLIFTGETKTKRPYVDHCHKTGQLRGLLCGSCNSALGMFRDSVLSCIRAGEYLTHYGATNN